MQYNHLIVFEIVLDVFMLCSFFLQVYDFFSREARFCYFFLMCCEGVYFCVDI